MNKTLKRNLKENQIIDAAEVIFKKQGYDNAKMEDIAKSLGISKGTVYFYLGSKENLYMAITYRAFEELIDLYNRKVIEHRDDKGIESVMGILRSFIDFNEEHFLYGEAMLNYISFVRSTAQGAIDKKLTDGMKESLYYQKVQAIQNTPMEIAIKEIKRGIQDGSIRDQVRPQMIYLNAWALVLGYTKLNDTGVSNRKTIMKIEVAEWKEYIMEESRNMIKKWS